MILVHKFFGIDIRITFDPLQFELMSPKQHQDGNNGRAKNSVSER